MGLVCYNPFHLPIYNDDMDCFNTSRSENSILIELLTKAEYEEYINASLELKATWLLSSNRSVKEGSHHLIPNTEGKVDQVVVIVDTEYSIWSIASLPWALPPGDYHLANNLATDVRQRLTIGWGLGAYRYGLYLKKSKQCACLYFADDIDKNTVLATVHSTQLVRNLINAPANDMMPTHLADAAKKLASNNSAEFTEIVGENLLEQNYPLIHAVGRASKYEPRLIKLKWGEQNHPLVCIVGKGVCFDSGGLNIKSATGMRWMKKDMGGAAHALGLASYIMERKLPIRIQVSIPAVENAIAGDAYRPGDVITSRLGKTVEIDNTDAEGRLVLADALAEIGEQSADLLIDFATLTGAARVAVGTEVGAFFSKQDKTAHGLYAAAKKTEDDIWRLPLHREYKHQLKSTIADMVNCASSGFGGAITAALFLESFVPKECDWVHFDIMAYNNRSRPGRPKGGEAMGLRSVCHYIEQRYENNT